MVPSPLAPVEIVVWYRYVNSEVGYGNFCGILAGSELSGQ